MDSILVLGITSSRIHHVRHCYFSIFRRKVVNLRCYLILNTNRELPNIAQRFYVWSTRGRRLQRVRNKICFGVLKCHPSARPFLARFVFPVSLLYRTLEIFNSLLVTFYCPVRLVCVPTFTESVPYCIFLGGIYYCSTILKISSWN